MSVKVNSSVTIHRGRVFRMVSENIVLPNGVSIDIETIRHPGASAIIPLSDKDTVMLIKQFRHAVGEYIWEIPAGTLDPEETPITCARRELIEEVGVSAGTWRKLGEITPVPGYSDERIHIFLATDLMPAQQNLESDELLDVHEVGFDEAINMIYEGAIQDSKTICGLFLTMQWLEHHDI